MTSHSEDYFFKEMDKNTCIICYMKAERLLSSCCGCVICQSCLSKQEGSDARKCEWCRGNMILTGYIDLPNAYQVYRKVDQVLKDQSEEDEKNGSAVRIR